jgi:hypothetical protein
MKKSKSIIPGDDEYCYLCKRNGIKNKGSDVHHLVFGVSKRKLADADGLTLHLCHLHHMMLHQQGCYKRELQELAQQTWQDHYNKTKEDWIRRYGKSYL